MATINKIEKRTQPAKEEDYDLTCAKYEVTAECFVGDRLYQPGEIIHTDPEFIGGWHLKPLNALAKKANPGWTGRYEEPLSMKVMAQIMTDMQVKKLGEAIQDLRN